MNNLIRDFNLKKGWAVARLNYKSFGLTAAILAGVFVLIILPGIIMSAAGGNVEGLGLSTTIYTFAIVFPVMLATSNFNKTMRLGAKKKDYFVGVLLFLAILAAAISAAGIALYYAVDKPVTDHLKTLYSLYRVMGFAGHGVVLGFLMQFGFLFFLSIVAFLIAGIQDTWRGWVTDVALALGVVVLTTVAVLRHHVVGAILYVVIKGHPAAQILFTLFVGFGLYCLYLLVLKRKKI